ncbi:MAG: hypothetical protein M3Y57_06355 [Acidobacteriota bacterium]|nr:hypothetical protein [Acidobacteriota bacterium]
MTVRPEETNTLCAVRYWYFVVVFLPWFGQSAVRVTGTIQPIRSFVVQVPTIQGQGGNLTLTTMVVNGSTVRKGTFWRNSIRPVH